MTDTIRNTTSKGGADEEEDDPVPSGDTIPLPAHFGACSPVAIAPTPTATRPERNHDMKLRYPDAIVMLDDGNAFAIIGSVRRALKNAGASAADLQEFTDEATGGDYENLLRTVFQWVQVAC
jgi:hypothetical protein